MTDALGYHRQTFYYYQNSTKLKSNEHRIMRKMVLKIREEQPRIGGKKLHYLLNSKFREKGIKIGRDKFFQFLKSEHLLVKRKKNRTITTRSYKRFREHPNRIKDLPITKPEQAWVSDITYLNCKGGPLYLSLITDAYSKKIMGYKVSDNLKTEITLSALKMAIGNRVNPDRKLVHHSDRGFQYASPRYTEKLQSMEIDISMTTKYDPYENAVAERINGILKQEFSISDYRLDKNEVEGIVKRSIETYNKRRPHWSNNLLTPEEAHEKGGFKMKTYRKEY